MIGVLTLVMAPIFTIIAIGFVWGFSAQRFDNTFVSTLVTYIGTPCLLLRTFDQQEIELAAFSEMAVAAVCMLGVVAIVGTVALTVSRLPLRDFLPSLLFPNVANMGLPVVLFALGEDGLALAIVVLIINVIAHNTIGIAIHTGVLNFRAMARMPVIYALAAGLFMMIGDVSLPVWLFPAVDILANLTIPLMLMALGVSLSRLPVSRIRTSVVVSGLRFFCGLAAAMAIGWILDLGPLALSVLVLQGTMPVAVLSYLYAERFGTCGDEVAGAVVVSTLLSLVTVPVMVLFMLS